MILLLLITGYNWLFQLFGEARRKFIAAVGVVKIKHRVEAVAAKEESLPFHTSAV